MKEIPSIGAQVQSEDLRVTGNEGWGVFLHGMGVVDHWTLNASHNRLAGVWAQAFDYLGLQDALVAAARTISSGQIRGHHTYSLRYEVVAG